MSEQSQQDKETPQQSEVHQDELQTPSIEVETTKPGYFSGMAITHLMMIVMVVVFGWQWFEGHRIVNDLQNQLAEKINEMVGGSKANHELLSKNQGRISELNDRITALEKRKVDAKSQSSTQEGSYDDLLASREETVLAEVEQLLLNAEQQLKLSANVRAALIVMQSADAQLRRMSQPTFKLLSKIIVRDMDKLRALPSIDINSINIQLNELIAKVDDLSIVSQQRVESELEARVVPPENEAFSQKLWRESWKELRQLVRIENTGMNEIPLLLPSQQFFLRENLKLRLLSARLALLTRDENTFRQDIKDSQRWTQRYFDTKSESGSAMLEGMNKLTKSKIYIALPDLGASLQAIRNHRLTLEKDGQ